MQFRDHPAVDGKRDFYPVDPRKLKIDSDYNVRSMDSPDTREHIAALKASIIANGVKVPLEVRLAPDDKIYIVAGHCRHAAVMDAIGEGHEIKTVPCIPEAKGTNEIDRVVNLVVSNSGKPLAPLEVAAVVKRLDAFGWSAKQIADRLGWKSTASVKHNLDLLEMSEPVKEHVRKGNVSATAARNLAKSDLSPEEQQKLLDANLEENRRIKGKRTTRVTPKQIKRATAKPAAKPPATPPAPAPAMISPEPAQATLSPDPILDSVVQAMTDAELEEGLVKAGYLQAAPDQSLLEKTREQVQQSNGWHPDAEPLPPRLSPNADLIAALEPFASLAHEHDFNARGDDDVIEVPVRHLKQAWIVFARVCGERDAA